MRFDFEVAVQRLVQLHRRKGVNAVAITPGSAWVLPSAETLPWLTLFACVVLVRGGVPHRLPNLVHLLFF